MDGMKQIPASPEVCAYDPNRYVNAQDLYQYRASVDLNCKIQYIQAMHALKLNEMSAKGQLELDVFRQKAELRENVRMARELERKALIEDSEGFLCVEAVRGDGKRKFSERISMVSHFRCEFMHGSLGGLDSGLIRFVWDGGPDNVILKYSLFSNGKYLDSLKTYGVIFKPVSSIQKVFVPMMSEFLIHHGSIIEIPDSHGWCLDSNKKWQFIKPGVINLSDFY